MKKVTRLPLYPLDTIQYRPGGGKVPHEEYLKAHADLLRSSPIWSSTMNSYRVVWLCHRRLTSRYRQLVADAASAEMRTFLEAIRQEYQTL